MEIYYQKVYKNFVEHVDAIDNGVAVAEGAMRYTVSTTLSSRVGHLNPSWNQPNTPEICNARFVEGLISPSFIILVHWGLHCPSVCHIYSPLQ